MEQGVAGFGSQKEGSSLWGKKKIRTFSTAALKWTKGKSTYFILGQLPWETDSEEICTQEV